MFTGIVEGTASATFEPVGSGAKLVLRMPPDWAVELGDSVSVSGCCLTVVSKELRALDAEHPDELDLWLGFDLSAETLARTHLRDAHHREVNVERALRLSDRLGGHLVSGHVDGLGTLTRLFDRGDGGSEMHFQVPEGLERYLLEKGSITIDGVSLTVVEPRGRDFHVAVIPETLKRTTFGAARPGDRVHTEADLVGKWIEKLLPLR